MTRILTNIDVSDAVGMAVNGTERIYFIDHGDSEVYEWDSSEPVSQLEDAEEIFAVSKGAI